MLKETNTPTRPRIEPGSPDPESDALTIRPARPKYFHILLTGKRNTTIEVTTPKIYKAELWFLCMTHCLIVLYNCMKFHLNSFNGCQLTERARNSIANDQREITPKNIQSRVMVLVQYTLSHCALQVYAVSTK